MNIRDTPEWKAIESDMIAGGPTQAIYNALARHKAECHQPTKAVADHDDEYQPVDCNCDGFHTGACRMPAESKPTPPDMVLVRRDDVKDAAQACYYRASDAGTPEARRAWDSLASRLEAALKPEDDGWRERCEVETTTLGIYVLCRYGGPFRYLSTDGSWVHESNLNDSTVPGLYFPTESTARAALAKAPKPEGTP